MQPKVMDVLLCLVEADGQVVSRQKLVESVWEGRPTSDEPVNRCIAELCLVLSDDRNNPRYIRTVPKRAYQLIALASEVSRNTTVSGMRLQSLKWISALVVVVLLALLAWWM